MVIDLVNGGGWDSPVEARITRVDGSRMEGYRFSKGWASDQKVFFAAEFSIPVTSLEVITDGQSAQDSGRGRRVYARASLDAAAGVPVYVKVALSPTSVENAWANMAAELPGWDFGGCVEAARQAWKSALFFKRFPSYFRHLLKNCTQCWPGTPKCAGLFCCLC